jgi:trimeric autotransporter adhesin
MSLAVDAGGSVATQPVTPSSTPPAQDIVAKATSSSTHTVDTKQLAQWVVDAGRASPEKASAAYAQIENQLGTGDKSRFAQDVADIAKGGSAYSATGAAQSVVTTGSRVLKQNPILEIQWHSTTSPVTGKAGFSGPLRDLLDKHGINHSLPVHNQPPKAVNNNSPASSNRNGDAARDQIADEFKQKGYKVTVEQSTNANGKYVKGEITPKGGRRIDVVAERGTGENKVRVEAESKLGRANAGAKTAAQVEKDGARLAKNVAARELGQGVKVLGKVARPVGLVVDAVEVGQAVKADGGKFGDHTQHAVGSLAGGAAGAWAGAEAGAAIGSLGGPVGTVVGGLVGGAVGGIVGSGVGEKAVDWVKSWL